LNEQAKKRSTSAVGTTRPSCSLGTRSVTQPEAAMASSSRHGRVVPYLEHAPEIGSEAHMSIEGHDGLDFLCDVEKARQPAPLGELGAIAYSACRFWNPSVPSSCWSADR